MKTLILFLFAICAMAQPTPPPSITEGPDAPPPNACQQLQVGNVYVRSENPNNGPINVSRCTQTGALTFAWQPVDHLVITTLPDKCSVGDIAFKSNATSGQNVYGCTATNTWTLQKRERGLLDTLQRNTVADHGHR